MRASTRTPASTGWLAHALRNGPLGDTAVVVVVTGIRASSGTSDALEFIRAKTEEEKKAHALIDMGYDGSFNGDAYGSVDFKNVNQSVRVDDAFMARARDIAESGEAHSGDEYALRSPASGEVLDTIDPSEALREIAKGTWFCGDPGLQYEDTIQRWHTVAQSERVTSRRGWARGDGRVVSAETIRSVYERGRIAEREWATGDGHRGGFGQSCTLSKTGQPVSKGGRVLSRTGQPIQNRTAPSPGWSIGAHGPAATSSACTSRAAGAHDPATAGKSPAHAGTSPAPAGESIPTRGADAGPRPRYTEARGRCAPRPGSPGSWSTKVHHVTTNQWRARRRGTRAID